MQTVREVTEIHLPWPPSVLSPNGSVGHWTKRSLPKAQYRRQCAWVAKKYNLKLDPVNIPISIVFYPPDKRRRDLDNLLASIKGGIDGICEVWNIDDKFFRPITIDFGESVKDGKIILTINTK